MRVYPLLSLTLLSVMLLSPLTASAKGGPAPPAAAAAAAQQNEREAMQRAQQVQQQQRAQQEAMMQNQAKQQQERAQQEQMVRAQEEQARKNQMQAVQQQQEQARKMQEQQQQVQQEQARKMQEQQQQVQQEQARKMQQQEQQVQQEQARKMQQQQQQVQQEQARKMQQQEQQVQQEQARKMQQQQQEQARNSQKERPQENAAFAGKSWQAGAARPFKAKTLAVSAVPIEKAVPQPVLEPNANAGEQQHAQAVTANLQHHLFAVPGAQAPQNLSPVVNDWRNNYFNNYSAVVNNRRISINRQNTNVSYFQPNQYPTWYQPQPNWVLSNGFTLGNDIHCGLDWLQWGWHPYYGPPPEGFVCADDYFPTPWVFIPAYGVWRQPGEFAYSPAGPPYDYTGPISVEVLEPRHVRTRDPYSGWVSDRVINVVYFYNAFYYPEFERWGYMNRHGYFIWLNLDQDD